MKLLSVLLFAGAALIILDSCKKKEVIVPEISSTLNGNWELRQTIGNTGTINYPPGNGSVVVFTDSSFSTTSPKDKIFIQGTGPSQGSYKIISDSTVNSNTGLILPSGDFSNRIIFNEIESPDKLFYQLNGDKLMVISGYFPTDGGYEKTYQRQ